MKIKAIWKTEFLRLSSLDVSKKKAIDSVGTPTNRGKMITNKREGCCGQLG